MTLFVLVIILALVFDFINGFHDAANSIATIVSTKVLSPLTAVLWAASFNFIAFWLFKLKVADTVSKTVETNAITLEVILCGIIAAIIAFVTISLQAIKAAAANPVKSLRTE